MPEAIVPSIPVTRTQRRTLFGANDRPIAHKRHVFQRLKDFRRRFHSLDPYWTEIITPSEFLAAAEHYGVERESAHALRVGQVTYHSLARDGLFRRLQLWARGYDMVDITGRPGRFARRFSPADPLIVGEVHCPIVDGATAKFATTSTQKQKIGVEITAAGIGGGGWSRERVFTSGSTIEIDAGDCSVLCTRLSGNYVLWRHLENPEDLLILVNVTGVDSLFHQPLADYPDFVDSHLCDKAGIYERIRTQIEAGALVAGQDYVSFENPKGKHVQTAEWETTREYSGRWGFETEEKGIKLEGAVTFSAHFTDKIGVEVVCPPGFDYIGRYRSARELPQQWAANPL